MKETFYTVYHIRNKLNNMIYVGSHKTNNLDDNYYGSGKNIKKIIKEIGRINLEKTIISYHKSNEEMLLAEKQIVNREFIERADTYNIIIGGGSNSADTVLVKNKEGKCFRVNKYDSSYLSGDLVTPNKGKIMVRDKNNNFYRLDRNDPRILSGEFISANHGKTLVYNEKNKKIWVLTTDPKFLDGTYRHITKGIIRSEESNLKISQTRKNKNIAAGKNNPNFGKTHVYNKESNQIKNVEWKDVDYWLELGWIKGRPLERRNSQGGTKWMYNPTLKMTKQIKGEEVNDYLNNGWILGKIFHNK